MASDKNGTVIVVLALDSSLCGDSGVPVVYSSVGNIATSVNTWISVAWIGVVINSVAKSTAAFAVGLACITSHLLAEADSVARTLTP